ncbi:DNA-binding SARP family transcriptional activator [Thermostichus sp. MS-CIW-21]|jgi:hypothetical protein|uniref:DUF2605 domain-containing protein n=1 Tax=unclassified Synechococcus TaxID=2626047 RepID=UPI0000694166|nr:MULTISPECIES: DUF2605 domain-containing protein [unclassified Synechococcus]ABC98935.1 conserved hypothetical protein [Synechococcus sp. JA-3-3Ab]PIK90985.1 hypothetical protein SYN65AY6LI_01135 [Synechococcus sp. 65AY6Li]
MSKAKLLREILGPLLEDYRYWFERSRRFLQEETLEFISPEAQQALLERVLAAQAELQAAEALYQLSDNEVGVDPALMAKWHRLLMECAELGRRFRQIHPSSDSSDP